MASLSKNSKQILRSALKITVGATIEFGWFMNELIDTLSDPRGKFYRGTAPKKIYWSVNNLRRGDYLEKTGRGNRKMIQITDKGRLVLLQEQTAQKPKGDRWDEKWRLIIFDIPEDDRRERNFLRSSLKSFGLKELQKSVWVYPYDIENEFYEFLKLCNKTFEGDIRFITVEKISRDDDLKRYFKLNRRDRTGQQR